MKRYALYTSLALLLAAALPAAAEAPPAVSAAVKDAAKFDADLRAGAPATVLAADSAALSADASAAAAALGVEERSDVLGKYRLDISLGGAASGGVALPSSTGASVGGGGGGGLLLDLGFGLASSSAVDHYHLDLSVTLNSLTAGGHTAPAVVVALSPAYQIDSTSPLLGVGPAIICPIEKLDGIRTTCVFGLVFTSGFAALLGSTGWGAPVPPPPVA